ncbi:MAG: hypothetical protein A3D21_02275 [Nitrospirae bacterium RIFCSPHIGHO2_02_FULL_42_12]|nr:MAG: hypothetical protein A3D21_02275 [Nitrospirae bacterium RIFCSPHIGHO2_02_FULL_42_12]
MKKVFFDTWGWAAIANKNDTHHEKIASFYKTFLLKKGVSVTTDYVLAETITLLRAKTDHGGVAVFIDTIIEAVKNGVAVMERINEERWEKAWKMSKKYSDKPYISFFDFSSFVVMKELGVSQVLTADKHFEDVGIGFKKLF